MQALAANSTQETLEEPVPKSAVDEELEVVPVPVSNSSNSMLGLVAAAVGAVCLVIVAWQCFKWLTSPKKTPAPLLADTELGEGDPVHGGDGPQNALWMGGSGPARELMPATSAGFTQF